MRYFIQIHKLLTAAGLLGCVMSSTLADTLANPCDGPAALLAIVDRPTVGDSACAVPYQSLVVESGYEYQQLRGGGQQQNYPEAEFRLGLPANNELVFLPPNRIHQSMSSQSGYSASVVGIKHEIGYSQHWLSAVEALVTLPSGSANVGSEGLGEAFNGIASYSFNPRFDLTFMFGGSSQTVSTNSGGQRFTSFNPDLVLTWSPQQKTSVYGEVYGQSKAAPGAGSGFNFNSGVVYLLFKNLTLDLEIGQHISGSLGGFNHYVGTGIALQL